MQRIGLCVVEDSSDLPVCAACAVEHALGLACVVSLAETARLLAKSERDFGVRFESLNFPEYIGGFSLEEIENINRAAEVAR